MRRSSSRRRLAAVAASEDSQERRDHYLALAQALEEGTAGKEGAGDYLVSKAWLRWAGGPGAGCGRAVAAL